MTTRKQEVNEAKFLFISCAVCILISSFGCQCQYASTSLVQEEDSIKSAAAAGGDDDVGGPLKYVWGDALSNPEAKGPDGEPYPW
jgi:hypothetical protein